MNKIVACGVAGVVVFAGLQLIRPTIPASAPQAEIKVPPHIHQILEKDCYSCHSSERRLAWYDEVQPAYWLVRADILTAREHLNFSTLGSKPEAAQKATLYEAVNMIQLGAMPLPRFTALHHEARVSPEELAELKAYLAPWAPLPPPAQTTIAASNDNAATNSLLNLATVKAEWTGVPFDPNFEGWKPLSYTDRGDNNTFRFILGNDIAVRAAQQGQIKPWPDGTRFAKIAWQQTLGSDGLVHPGKFVQVELMIKDTKQYASTDGWGWGRWRGADLKPYGQNAKFVNECTGCHQPVKGNDYVYTLPMTTASVPGTEIVNNRAATLPKSLPYQPLAWTPITMFVDPKAHTLTTVFANDAAVPSYTRRGTMPAVSTLPVGATLAVVTWTERDDPHWFGGRMPDTPSSVEFVTSNVANTSRYLRFDGLDLTETHVASDVATKRTGEILAIKPALLP